MSDYALVEGMAVTHPVHGTGEIMKILDKDLGDGTPPAARVEFGEEGVTETVPLADIDVDWKFYRDGTSVHQ